MADTPELRFLSENRCPNSGPDHLFGRQCNPDALTWWGYCGTCWQWPSRIPREWVARVDEEMARVRTH